ncbi:hypothetical protein TNCV_3100391 [Trichonephila clavipes]|nr:hypothetical protein TNCV_3100391 [Trichonephila clavipes]
MIANPLPVLSRLKVIPLVMWESLEEWMPTQTSSSYLDQGSESRGPSPLAPSCVRNGRRSRVAWSQIHVQQGFYRDMDLCPETTKDPPCRGAGVD